MRRRVWSRSTTCRSPPPTPSSGEGVPAGAPADAARHERLADEPRRRRDGRRGDEGGLCRRAPASALQRVDALTHLASRLARALLDVDHQVLVGAARARPGKARRGHRVAFAAAWGVRVGLLGRATVVCGVENEVITVVMEAARTDVAAAGSTDAALADEEVWRRWIGGTVVRAVEGARPETAALEARDRLTVGSERTK